MSHDPPICGLPGCGGGLFATGDVRAPAGDDAGNLRADVSSGHARDPHGRIDGNNARQPTLERCRPGRINQRHTFHLPRYRRRLCDIHPRLANATVADGWANQRQEDQGQEHQPVWSYRRLAERAADAGLFFFADSTERVPISKHPPPASHPLPPVAAARSLEY